MVRIGLSRRQFPQDGFHRGWGFMRGRALLQGPELTKSGCSTPERGHHLKLHMLPKDLKLENVMLNKPGPKCLDPRADRFMDDLGSGCEPASSTWNAAYFR